MLPDTAVHFCETIFGGSSAKNGMSDWTKLRNPVSEPGFIYGNPASEPGFMNGNHVSESGFINGNPVSKPGFMNETLYLNQVLWMEKATISAQ